MDDLRAALRGETPPLVTPFHHTDDAADADRRGTDAGRSGTGGDRDRTDGAHRSLAVDHDALADVVRHVCEGGESSGASRSSPEHGSGGGETSTASRASSEGSSNGDEVSAANRSSSERSSDEGVDALFPLGTNGEFASLTAREQRRVVETVVAESGDRPVVAGVSDTAVEDVAERAAAAADAGADAVVCTPAFFHTANEARGTVAFLEAVADASELPLLLYNIPQNVGDCMDVESVAALAEREDVLGIKDSSGDLAYTLKLARETPDEFLVLQGYDTLLLPGLRTGLDGGVNALANVVPETFRLLLDRPESDAAREASDALAELFDVCLDAGFAPVVKTALVERGVIEDDAVRPPLVSAGEHRRRVADALEDVLDATRRSRP